MAWLATQSKQGDARCEHAIGHADVLRGPWPAGERRPVERIDPLELVVDGLAAYRLTRLATADVISEPLRRSVVDRLVANGHEDGPDGDTAQDVVDAMSEPPRLARLLTCRWCAGVWIAAGVVGARAVAPKVWSPVARTLALSAAATLIARAED